MPAPPQAKVLRGPREPVWGCQCGKHNNWACRIVCSCGRPAPQRVINAAKKADKEARAQGGQQAPSRPAGGAGLVPKPAPWSKEYGLMEQHIRVLVQQCISQHVGSATGVTVSPKVSAPAPAAAGAGGGGSKEQELGNVQQRTELQSKINFHEKGLKECDAVEEEGGPLHLLHQSALEDLRQRARALRPPGAAHKAASQKLTRCRQQLDRFTTELQSLQEQLAATQLKIQEKQDAIEAKRAEVEVHRKEAAKQEQAMQAARGEKPTAPAPIIKEEDLVGFDLDEQLGDAGAKEALAQFKASPHFAQIQEALRKQAAGRLATAMAEAPDAAPTAHDDGGGAGEADGRPAGAANAMDEDGPEPPGRGADKRGAKEVQFVDLVKEDVEDLWQQLHKDGQQPAEWTKEQLAEAVKQVQHTKHRKTEAGSLRTGGSPG